ncbi:glycerophosphodiester phosphodiesterase [Caldimonas brevitalea]|uniref:glycerophosphodiester phosphodiesterase n=1 Tax=Caldimonas brevitalea TaxID=413882 RepID=A0A0G3BJN4_9BURK|nr:glycerophosphodiester phosphodiesterase [Caldimonas brevitalea]AKJ29587.1 glycerophosphodiester phosphodiesterase [Caldimonas brevitalea]
MVFKSKLQIVSLVAAVALAACGGGDDDNAGEGGNQPLPEQPAASRPLVIGHRGASGYLPEHTLEAYARAIEMGADYIEPDLVSTRDGRLIARHEPNITATTDVASRPEFADRKRKRVVDGVEEEGYFASDFTLDEIRTLRAKQPMADRDQRYNGQFQIPTFEEVLKLAQDKGRETGRTIGVYPETKHPTYHQALGLPLEDKLLKALTDAGWNRADAPVFIQSFEQANLKALRQKTQVKLVQLVDANDQNPDTGEMDLTAPYDRPYDWTAAGRKGPADTYAYLLTERGLDEVKTYADGIGPWKRYLVKVRAKLDENGQRIDVNGDGVVNEADFEAVPDDSIVKAAHARGLVVHAYTFRNEAKRLAGSYGNDPGQEYRQFFSLGLDGVFSDFPDTAVRARDAFVASRP